MSRSQTPSSDVLSEKASSSEKRIGPIRLLVVTVAVFTFPLLPHRPDESLRAGAWVLAICTAYSVALLLWRPYHLAKGHGWAHGVSFTDACLTLAWLAVSGGVASPYYGALYACMLAIALRHGFRATLVGAAGLAAGALLVTGLGARLEGVAVETAVRLVYLVFVGLGGALFSSEIVTSALRLKQANDRLRAEIAERRLAERRLRVQARELTRSNRQLENFAYMASHDLQEPLRMVTNYCLLLERRYKDKLGPDGADFVHFAVEGATRMKDFIDAILAFSRVQREKWDLAPLPLEETLDQALANLGSRLLETHALITSDPLPLVRGNAALLVHVFQNLLANGIKFNRSGAPRIHIMATRQGDHCTISVRDNGIGIESQYRDRLFSLFRRLHPRHEFEGTGLGLAICKEIVEKHGGKIWFESTPGQGTVFFFTLEAIDERKAATGEERVAGPAVQRPSSSTRPSVSA